MSDSLNEWCYPISGRTFCCLPTRFALLRKVFLAKAANKSTERGTVPCQDECYYTQSLSTIVSSHTSPGPCPKELRQPTDGKPVSPLKMFLSFHRRTHPCL